LSTIIDIFGEDSTP